MILTEPEKTTERLDDKADKAMACPEPACRQTGLLQGYRVDLFQFLFGDIVAITTQDILIALGMTVVVGGILIVAWKPLFKITFNRDTAAIAGVRVQLYEYIFLSLLAVVTAVAIKIVGIILVPALLVIPAATASNTK